MTLRDALPMAAGRYEPYAALLAQGFNLNRAQAQKPINPDDINPYLPKKPEYDAAAEIGVPWSAVCARLERCGFK